MIYLPGALSGLDMVGQVFLGDVHITMFFRLPISWRIRSLQVSIRIVGMSAGVSHRVDLKL